MGIAGIDEFQDRVMRIEASKAVTRATIFVGMDEAYHLPVTGKGARPKPASPLREALSEFLAHVWAYVFGYLSYAVILFLRLVMPVADDLSPVAELGINVIGAALVSVALAQVLRLNTARFRALQLIGIGLSVISLHNLVHWYPEFFGAVFSPVWVGQMIASAPANSLAVTGYALRF